jgi:hypothetical protein
MDGSPTTRVDYGSEEAAMQAYLRDGEARAATLGNRGPIRFTGAGELHPDIVEAYWRCGFYVFEGVLEADELLDIERDLHEILDRLPPAGRGLTPRAGRRWRRTARGELFVVRPLGDLLGGTDLANGRHPVKMFEPTAAMMRPKSSISSWARCSSKRPCASTAIRSFGRRGGVNGPDFTPFNEALFIKELAAAPRWPGTGTAPPIGQPE